MWLVAALLWVQAQAVGAPNVGAQDVTGVPPVDGGAVPAPVTTERPAAPGAAASPPQVTPAPPNPKQVSTVAVPPVPEKPPGVPSSPAPISPRITTSAIPFELRVGGLLEID
jgi:hypothetical protein